MQGLVVAITCYILIDKGLTLLLCVAVLGGLLVRTLVEWGRSDVEVSALDHLRHKAIEECHDQRVDVRTIDVGVGHDDNLIVTQLVDIGLAVAFAFYAKAYANRLDDVHHRLGLEDAMPLDLLDVQDLTTQRQDGLEMAIATLLG